MSQPNDQPDTDQPAYHISVSPLTYLKNKQKRGQEQKNPFKKDEIYGVKTLYREIGYYLSRGEDYPRALKNFNEAVKSTPTDERALIGRARTRAKTGAYAGAMDDVNKVLELNPDQLTYLADKSLTTFLSCEFEDGLVQNTRLLPKRQKPEHFSLGIMQCSNAIENCIGLRAGRPLRDHYETIRNLAWKKNYADQKPFEYGAVGRKKKKRSFLINKLKLTKQEQTPEPVQPKKQTTRQSIHDDGHSHIRDSLYTKHKDEAFIPPLTDPFPFAPMQKYTSNLKNYMAEKYLDSMYQDKIFLESIPNENGANCPNKAGAAKIKEIAKRCRQQISEKQKILRTRRPFYFIKYQEAKVSGTLQHRQQQETEHMQTMAKKEADNILNKLIDAYKNKQLKTMLQIVEKLKRYLDSKPKKIMPDKSAYMNEIYDKVCNGFYDVYRINTKADFFTQNKRVYMLLGLPLTREPSTDSVVVQFRGIFQNYKKEITTFENRLKNATVPGEVCWYYHELARYYLEMDKYDLSRAYARNCIQTAKRLNNQKWIFNCLMLTMKSNLKQSNKNDAKLDLKAARDCAYTLNDKTKQEFLDKCLEAIENVEFDDSIGEKEIAKREKKIVQMMASSNMKNEVAHLFKQISAMPPCRRMTVMPGVRPADQGRTSIKGSAPGRGSSRSGSTARPKTTRGMSIMPTIKESCTLDLRRSTLKGDSKGKRDSLMNYLDIQ